jgi:choline-glycine betaine transporter
MTETTAVADPAVDKKIRWPIFLIPWLLVVATVAINFISGDAFNAMIMTFTDFTLGKFGWLFTIVTLTVVILIAVAYFSPFGNVRLGGSKARPMMRRTNYVWIVLCTIMAAGILLWAVAEPMYHYFAPPVHITAESPDAITWLMETIFLEWTFTPMCIYGVPAVLFAFCFYNMKRQNSIGSMLYPAISEKWSLKLSPVVDVLCLFALVVGMAASMGSAVFLISDGASSLTGAFTSGNTSWIIVAAVIVAAFVTSAATGIMKGIRVLSTVNSYIYFGLGLFVFLVGPTFFVLDLIVESFGAYISDFFRRSLFISAADGDGWAKWWPVFYWCNWLAWMPVTSVFLGRISRGYSVREAINVIVIIPSLFSVVWLGLFSGTSVNFELAGLGIHDAMVQGGTASATYAVLQNLPLAVITIPLFLLIVFVSFVTASDSNTNAMSGLCMGGDKGEDVESPLWMKIVWGATIGVVCCVFIVAFQTTDALKYESNLAGFPIVFLLVVLCISFIKVLRNPAKYDTHKEDYDEHGRPIPSKRLPAEDKSISIWMRLRGIKPEAELEVPVDQLD